MIKLVHVSFMLRRYGANLLLQYRKIFHPYPELSNLNSLHGIEINEVDMNDIFSVYPNLKELWLWGKPGYIRNFSVLESFRNIVSFRNEESFWLQFRGYSCARTDGTSKLAWMTSLPEDAAKCIKKIIQEAKKRRNESFRHAGKKPEWIKEIWIIHSEMG